MTRSSRARRLVALIVTTILAATLLAPPAGADTPPDGMPDKASALAGLSSARSAGLQADASQRTVTASATATYAEADDAVGDVDVRPDYADDLALPNGDLTRVRIDHAVSTIRLSAWTAGGGNPVTDPNWSIDGESILVWFVDNNGDEEEEALVLAWVEDDGTYRAYAFADELLDQCMGLPVTFDATTHRHRVTVPRVCLGNPAKARVWAGLQYDLDGAGTDDNAVTLDFAPDLDWTAFAVRAQTATTLTSKVSVSTVTSGQAVTISGTLTRASDGKALSGQRVHLYRRYGSGSYVRLGSATTASDGRVKLIDKPNKNATYQLRHAYAGRTGPGYAAANSTTRAVSVRPKVTLTVSPGTTVKSGTIVKLTTTVGPRHPGTQVVLQKRRADGTWASVQQANLNSDSVRTFRITAGKSTVGTYRVLIGKHGDHAQGTSPTRTIKLG